MAWDKIKEELKGAAEKGVDLAGESLANAKEKSAEKKEQKKIEKQELQEHLRQLDKEGIAYCPKCHSTDLSANKRGFKLTTGIFGMNKILLTCKKCGNKFKPGRK